jgi:hypothetical protein
MGALPRWAAWSVAVALSLSCSASDKPDRDADAPLTASGSCRTRAEQCNARDDDCDGIIDERADTSCGLAHAAASCVRGRCVIERCSQGYLNCNDIMSDGCETLGECGACTPNAEDCEQPAVPAESMTPGVASGSASGSGGTPDAPSSEPDAAMPPATPAQTPQTSQTPQPDEADGGEDLDAAGPVPVPDAGSCGSELCDGRDNDCDTKIDEAATCSCEAAAPTGQGPECDRCLCDACPEALAACTGTEDDKWNTLCGNVLACFGKSVQAGLCTGDDSDCFQNGDGPCASEFRAAFELGWTCTADPVRTPCGALTRVRLECFKNQCAAVCKA